MQRILHCSTAQHSTAQRMSGESVTCTRSHELLFQGQGQTQVPQSPCLWALISHHPDGGLVQHSDEGQHGAGAADDGQGLPGEGGVHHAAHGRRSDHLLCGKENRGREGER